MTIKLPNLQNIRFCFLFVLFLLTLVTCDGGGGGGLKFFLGGGSTPPTVTNSSLKVGRQGYAGLPTGRTLKLGSLYASSVNQYTMVITNTSSESITLSGAPNYVILGGSHSDQFSLTQPTSNVLSASATQTFTLTFSPKTLGVKKATLKIVSDDPLSSNFLLNIEVTATPLPGPDINLSYGDNSLTSGVSNLNFATSSGTTQTNQLTIYNIGDQDLTISNTSITGTDSSKFSLSALSGSSTIVSGGSRTISITFAPTSSASYSASFNIQSNDSSSPFQIALNGTGTSGPVPNIKVSYVNNSSITEDATTGTGHTFSFGSILPGASSSSISVTILNSGTANLTLPSTPVTLSGTNQSEFSVTQPPLLTLSPNSSTTFTIKFSPSSNGSKTAKVTLASSNGDLGSASSSAIDLSGVGGSKDVLIQWNNAKEKDVNKSGGGFKVCYKKGSTFTAEGDSGVTCTNVPWTSGSYAPNSKLITFTSTGTYYVKLKSYSTLNTGSAFSSQFSINITGP
ncbi:choice-of-anchor D domain-containing protein [Leptospira selangorensis]|uniref:choice-of-anchor D domain-containing protein n=1 Tax=Leptospira selangorensis TaxID=2484982 RepID=UPI001082F53B|nr:choice-of-anchor D domain-containing protein [Leptospira selangorensis]TGK04354.1 choice-of-anchor D domain-containing protein [Leptospira selangorensis]